MSDILWRSVELGHIDIITEGSFLSSFNISPQRGHLEAAYWIFTYLHSHKKGDHVVFDDTKDTV